VEADAASTLRDALGEIHSSPVDVAQPGAVVEF
jgi:hypothetical protein